MIVFCKRGECMLAFNQMTFLRKRYAIIAACLLLLPFTSAFTWPLDTLEFSISAPGKPGDGTVLIKKELVLGGDIENTIIHSVQLTPVIDVYRVQEGRIWAWREKIQSHNAGLPSLKPQRGRFIYDAPWMIVEGGGASWERIHYRVGTETLGKNRVRVGTEPRRELWREVPGKVLVIRAVPGGSYCFIPGKVT